MSHINFLILKLQVSETFKFSDVLRAYSIKTITVIICYTNYLKENVQGNNLMETHEIKTMLKTRL